jgi:sugar-phosphatase
MRAYVVAGPAGAGKSTLGAALARRTGAALLDLDTLTDRLLDLLFAGTGLPGHWHDERHRHVVRPARYAALLDAAADQARVGRDVVLTAPFTAELRGGPEWEALRRALLPAEPVVAWLHAPATVLARRVRDRGEPRDASTAAAPEPARPRVPHLPVDATTSTQAQLALVLGSVDRPGWAP